MDRMGRQYKIIKIRIIALGVVMAFVMAGLKTPEAVIQGKLEGFWYIEFEDSYLNRDSIYDFNSVIIYIQKNDTIELPGVSGIYEDQKSEGVWKVISIDPDSVLFDVPKNMFQGKYAVRFFIDHNGWVSMDMPDNIFKMELKNDSTLLTCSKAGAMFDRDVRSWERNGWKIWPE
jgi:hypothetical protein